MPISAASARVEGRRDPAETWPPRMLARRCSYRCRYSGRESDEFRDWPGSMFNRSLPSVGGVVPLQFHELALDQEPLSLSILDHDCDVDVSSFNERPLVACSFNWPHKGERHGVLHEHAGRPISQRKR